MLLIHQLFAMCTILYVSRSQLIYNIVYSAGMVLQNQRYCHQGQLTDRFLKQQVFDLFYIPPINEVYQEQNVLRVRQQFILRCMLLQHLKTHFYDIPHFFFIETMARQKLILLCLLLLLSCRNCNYAMRSTKL